jgi:hypothetical protein
MNLFRISVAMSTMRVLGVNADTPCDDCNNLESLFADMKNKMPLQESEAYVVPDQNTMDDFQQIVSDMLEGLLCDEIDLRSLTDKYAIGTFTDQDNDKDYASLHLPLFIIYGAMWL